MGSLYKRGDIYWLKYYRNGKPYRESSHTDKITKAEKLLKKREGEIAEGKLPGVYFDKVRFDDLAEDLLTDYRINERDTLKRLEWSIGCLKETFGGMRATDIDTSKIRAYIEKRMKAGLSNASVNRELSALKRIFSLGVECTPPKVNLIPHIPMLKEPPPRKGFFELEEHLALRNALPFYLKPVATFGYHTGWRHSEVLNLTWDKVDMKQGIITLDPGEAKNEEARSIYLNEELMEEIKTAHSKRVLGCPYVFHNNGKRIKRFTRAWKTACIKAGLCEVLKDDNGNPVVVKERVVMIPTKIFHDYRRTAVRNMVRAGIPEKVAMRISGHKTRSVFDRYNITSGEDLKEAAKKMQTYHEKLNLTAEIQDKKHGEVIPFERAQNE